MSIQSIKVGDMVHAAYKTGTYLAEAIEVQASQEKVLVKVTAVVKHPAQGDLHNYKKVAVPLFHQRKALAQFEKVWVPASTVKPYDGEVPEYTASLTHAFNELMAELQEQDNEWAKRSIEQLNELKTDYCL